MFVAVVIYALFCVGLAYYDAVRIKQDKRIYHGLNGAAHLVIIMACGIWIHPLLAVAMLFEGRLVFDISLNLFRGLPFDYVPLYPQSLVDRMEQKVFDEDGLFPKVVYANLFIIFLLLKTAVTS